MLRTGSGWILSTFALLAIVLFPSISTRPSNPDETTGSTSTTTVSYGFNRYTSIDKKKVNVAEQYKAQNESYYFPLKSLFLAINQPIKDKSYQLTKNKNSTNFRMYFISSRSNEDIEPADFGKILINNELDTTNKLINQREILNYWNRRSKAKKQTTPSKILISKNKKKKPVIHKVITTWSDNARFEDLKKFTKKNDMTNSNNNSKQSIETYSDYVSSIEDKNIANLIRKPSGNLGTKVHSAQTNVISGGINVIDDAFGQPLTYHTTVVKYPQQFGNNYANIPHKNSYPSNTIHKRPINSMPLEIVQPPSKYHQYINSEPFNSHYPIDHNYFESSTNYPLDSISDTIIINPHDYNGNNECPTITLKINNTFKSEGKEACPDLNIAVNTNVVNKNIIVEEETSSNDSESSENAIIGDFLESTETEQTSNESENVVSTEYSYEDIDEHALSSENPETLANIDSNSASSSQSLIGIATNNPIAYNRPSRPGRPGRPGRPSPSNDQYDDDNYLATWIAPVSKFMSFLALLNPFNYGLISVILAPIAVALAGGSGLVALLGPLALPYARESKKNNLHEHHQKWVWDPGHKAWSWNAFPNNRNWRDYHLDPRSVKKRSLNNKMFGDRNSQYISFMYHRFRPTKPKYYHLKNDKIKKHLKEIGR